MNNEEFYDLYSLNIIRVIKSRWRRWAGHVALCGGGKVYTGFWWGNLRGKILARPRFRWEDNIKMDLQEVG
jgi:hypothetical protein